MPRKMPWKTQHLNDAVLRGTLGASEPRNTAEIFAKYRNIAKKKIAKYRNTAIPCRNSMSQ